MQYYDPITEIGVAGRFAYDSANKRQYMSERRFSPIRDGEDQYFHIYALWNGLEGPMLYSFNVNTTACRKTRITWPWRPFGIDPGAEFRRTSTIGAKGLPGAGVNIDIWVHKYRDNRGIITGIYEEEFTSKGCVPVRQQFINMSDPRLDYREEHWYSTTLGIKDPNIFMPPLECFTNDAVALDNAATADFKTWSMSEFHPRPQPMSVPQPRAQQAPIPCIAPLQWNAHSTYYDPGPQVMTRSELTYDALGQREYAFEQRETPMHTGEDEFFQVYAFWKTMPPKLYVYDVNTTVCASAPILTPFIPIGVPLNSTFRRSVVIGTNGFEDGGVEVNVWSQMYNDNAGRPSLWFETQVTANGCVPVRETFMNISSSPRGFKERHWHDVTLGIRDEGVFALPIQCWGALEVAEAPADRREWNRIVSQAVHASKRAKKDDTADEPARTAAVA